MVVTDRRISVKWAQGRVVQPAYRQLACIEEVMFEQVSNEKSISGFRVNCPSPCESVPHCLSHVDGELPAATGLSHFLADINCACNLLFDICIQVDAFY
jgi:hypothetical protein